MVTGVLRRETGEGGLGVVSTDVLTIQYTSIVVHPAECILEGNHFVCRQVEQIEVFKSNILPLDWQILDLLLLITISRITTDTDGRTEHPQLHLQHLRLRVTPAYAQIRHGELLTTAAQQANTPRHERARDRPPETLVLDGATWQPPESRRGSRGRLRAGVGGDVVEEVVVGDLAERRRVGGVDEGVQPEEDEVAVGRREVAHPLPLGPPGQLR